MTMPEAAMNEDGNLVSGKDDVRLPRQVFPMQTISESQRMEMAADMHLRLGVPAPD